MNLIVDIGNTRTKVAVVDGGEVVRNYLFGSAAELDVEAIVAAFPAIRRAIVASTGEGEAETVERLERAGISTLRLDYKTPLPIGNEYLTPQTLGVDRIAAAVGAVVSERCRNCMIVDFGTAITIDVVEDGIFKGGNISPGATTRMRALHDYTSRLPMCEPTDECLSYGRTTREAIEQGVMQGITHEIEGYIDSFLVKNEEKSIIFTGGEAKYFANRIKNAIFAKCDLVVCGLNSILEYNASEK